MELNELRSLLALAEHGTITEAAEHLHLTPPAIHRHLKTLAHELGAPLYEKVGRRVRLTQASEFLLPYLKDLMSQYNSVLSAFEEWKGMGRGSVRIGTGVTSYVLPIVLKKFRRAHPGVELLVESSGSAPVTLEHLISGSLDLALVVSADLIDAQNISVEASWDYELVLVSHGRQHPGRPRLADLKHFPFILFRKGSRFEESIGKYFSIHGFEPKVIMRFDSAEFIRSMTLAGLGVSMLPWWLVHKDVREKRLNIIRQAEPPLHSNISLVRRKSTFLPESARAFIATARGLGRKDLPLLTTRANAGHHEPR